MSIQTMYYLGITLGALASLLLGIIWWEARPHDRDFDDQEREHQRRALNLEIISAAGSNGGYRLSPKMREQINQRIKRYRAWC